MTSAAAPLDHRTRAPLRVAALMLALMVGAAVLAYAIKPAARTTQVGSKWVLEQVVPARFGDWQALPGQGGLIVNPQTQQLLDKLYSQVLTRTYVHRSGYRIMLSLAYGDDQRGELQAHKPEVCYPAQGFAVRSTADATLATPYGAIAGRRLDTSLGARREPVTYWFTMGDTQVRHWSRLQMRLMEVRMGLTGRIPDGLLFRVSSIDDDTARGFERQQEFVNDLLKALPPKDRARLTGLQPAPAAPG